MPPAPAAAAGAPVTDALGVGEPAAGAPAAGDPVACAAGAAAPTKNAAEKTATNCAPRRDRRIPFLVPPARAPSGRGAPPAPSDRGPEDGALPNRAPPLRAQSDRTLAERDLPGRAPAAPADSDRAPVSDRAVVSGRAVVSDGAVGDVAPPDPGPVRRAGSDRVGSGRGAVASGRGGSDRVVRGRIGPRRLVPDCVAADHSPSVRAPSAGVPPGLPAAAGRRDGAGQPWVPGADGDVSPLTGRVLSRSVNVSRPFVLTSLSVPACDDSATASAPVVRSRILHPGG